MTNESGQMSDGDLAKLYTFLAGLFLVFLGSLIIFGWGWSFFLTGAIILTTIYLERDR